MPKMRAVQVSRPGGPLELVERPVPDPGPDSVRIKVQTCAICHSDVMTTEGHWPGITYPRVPGHEVVGVIEIRAGLALVVPRPAFYAAGALGVVMAGAVFTHLWYGEVPQAAVPFVLLGLLAMARYAHRPRTSA